MWRVCYSDHGRETHPLNNRILDPLMANSQTVANLNSIYYSPTTKTPYTVCKKDFSTANHQAMAQQKKRGGSILIEEVGMAASSRWNPTPEQLYALEEIYRNGTRTPSANQIQQIAISLHRFGKIEGKNVFYWFQNHKARERQKRRRRQLHCSSSLKEDEQLHLHNIESSERKISGLSRTTGFEVRQTKNWMTPSDCSTISEESISMTTAEAAEVDKGKRNRFELKEPHQKMNTSCSTFGKHAISNKMEFSHNFQKVQNLEILSTPNRDSGMNEGRKYQTLELFPLWVGDIDEHQIGVGKNASEVSILDKSDKFTPIQFFEFL